MIPLPAHSPRRSRTFLWIALLALVPLLAACGGGSDPAPATVSATVSATVTVASPASAPTEAPTEAPTVVPTAAPKAVPTLVPTVVPTVDEPAAAEAAAQGLATATPEDVRVPAYGFTVINTYPHDTGAYTQGLQYVESGAGGVFYEGTGRHGASSLRRVEIETGAVLQQHDLADDYFGEGIVVVGDRIYQLTWQEQTAFLYDRASFDELQQFSYTTEGWGLTFDGEHLVMSDGSSTLFFRDPATFEELGRLDVTYLGAPLTRLNELEFIDGLIWANVYQTNYIVQIDPETGIVQGVVDLSGLLDTVDVTEPVDVLNGIAWDAANQRLFVTGKWWPAVFEITLHQVGWAQ